MPKSLLTQNPYGWCQHNSFHECQSDKHLVLSAWRGRENSAGENLAYGTRIIWAEFSVPFGKLS
jgi:hypothetical protein